MKNFLYLLGMIVFLVLFTACGAIEQATIDEKMLPYEVMLSDVSYFFYYPASALLEEEDGVLKYGGCLVNFGEDDSVYRDEIKNLSVESVKKEGKIFEAVYSGGMLVAYAGVVSNPDYLFWVTDLQNGVTGCMEIVNLLAKSFAGEPGYKNEKYGFSVDLPMDYKVENLPSGEGVLVKKWVEIPVEEIDSREENPALGYKVEMVVFGTENLVDWENVGQLVADKYSGYTVEFDDGGVYVDEGSGDYAVRHFFMMKDGVIYEAYLKVPSIRYSYHKEEFSEFVRTIEVF